MKIINEVKNEKNKEAVEKMSKDLEEKSARELQKDKKTFELDEEGHPIITKITPRTYENGSKEPNIKNLSDNEFKQLMFQYLSDIRAFLNNIQTNNMIMAINDDILAKEVHNIDLPKLRGKWLAKQQEEAIEKLDSLKIKADK